MPSSRPRITFDAEGVCNACRYHEAKKEIDWNERAAEFDRIIAPRTAGAPYDCVVPFSGGKDSATVAVKLRTNGLHPLLVCYGQLLWTDVGQRNLHRIADLGFDIFYWRVDQRVSRKLARRFFIERGHPKQHYDAGVNSVPLITAKNFGIPLVFYAEHGETEYGGHILSEDHRRTRDLAEVLEHQVGDHPVNWATDGITEGEIWPYVMPETDVTAYYFSYFFPWDIYENAKFARNELGFEQALHILPSVSPRDFQTLRLHDEDWWGKSDGSFEGFDSIDDKIDDLDFYMMWIKFGFGRATRMASRLIQNGHLTRDQGLELVRAYDGEFPESYLPDVLEYLGLSRDELIQIIDKHRNPEIWGKEQKHGQLPTWRLRHEIG
jgi:N-acetyl sugar amidotransferase